MKPIILSDYQCRILEDAVKLRDDYTCILCQRGGGSVHHVLHRSYTGKGNTLVWQLSNMCVLCNEHHAEAHSHPLVMRDILLRKMMELYSYDYSCRPFSEYLIEKETDEKGMG